MWQKINYLLLEATKNTFISKAKSGGEYKNKFKGKNRFERQRYSTIPNASKQFNQIDMNKFFKDDELLVKIPVIGETDNYTVSLKLFGVVAEIQKNIKNNKNKLEFRTILQSITKIYNTTDIYIKCTCPDYTYTWKHGLIVNNMSVDDTASDNGPGKGIRNPKHLPGLCKHSIKVLMDSDWIMKIASVIWNYIKYAEKNLQKPFLNIIFPKLYGVKAEDMITADLIDDEKYIKNPTGLIDAINKFDKNKAKNDKKEEEK